MVSSLHDDCTRLNERQDRILLLFGKLVNTKYQITNQINSPIHSNNNYAISNGTYTNGGRIAGKQEEVYYDTKWKPLVEAHQRLMEAVVGGGGSSSRNDNTSVNVGSNRGSNNRDDTRMSGSINGGIDMNGISGKNKLPLSSSHPSNNTPLLFNNIPSKINTMPPSLSPLPSLSSISLAGNFPSVNPETLGCEYKLKRERRMLSSAVAKHLFFTASKGFGRVRRSSSTSISALASDSERYAASDSECYAAAKRAVDSILHVGLEQNRPRALDFIDLCRDTVSGNRNRNENGSDSVGRSAGVALEWKAGHALRRQPKYRRVLRFINNSPSFFSHTSPSNYLYSGWGGCVRNEMAKAVEASLGQLEHEHAHGHEHGHGPRYRHRHGYGHGYGEREVPGDIRRRHGGDPDDVDFDFDFDAIGTYSSSQGEVQLREVISALDEKLRDLKKKYAEEMRRSLHIQSELMKAESEKLDLVEHFSRLLEEKDIELGFLQKSARGDDSREHESYFGSVSHTRPPSLNKDFFKKGILEKEEHSGLPQIKSKVDHTLPTVSPAANVAPNEPSFTALASLPHSARSSVSSVADLMRFEAALEQILPDLGPDEAQPVVGELDKELFERFVMRDDTSSGASSPKKTPRSPTREFESTPRSAPQTPRSEAQTPRSAAQTPRSAIQTPRSAAQTPRSESQTPRSAAQTPRSESQSPQKRTKHGSNAHTPRSASHKPSASNIDNEELNEDSDFDEFAEFAEYQDYEVEDAIEAYSEGYYSNRSTHFTQNGGRLSTARVASTSALTPSSSARASARASAPLPTSDANRSTTSPKRVHKSNSSTSVSSASSEDRYPATPPAPEQVQVAVPVPKQPTTSAGQTQQSGRFAVELDRYMDMDLQDLMALVNDKYRAEGSEGEDEDQDVDPVDIEALKKQYGFDD